VSALILLAAYLIGSIPFSYLVARWRGVDVRKVGSGNVGATNVMRSAGKAAGLLAFLLDALKGAGAAVLGYNLCGRENCQEMAAAAAAAAVLGHVYPVWLRFKGGKGVATGAGAFLPLCPIAAGVGVVSFAVVTAASRYVSVGSIVGATALALTTFVVKAHPAVCWAAAFCATLIVVKHRDNIRRLRRGDERRIGADKSAA
jgi:glycerol-3-phosphate acyltransferase PlsY